MYIVSFIDYIIPIPDRRAEPSAHLLNQSYSTIDPYSALLSILSGIWINMGHKGALLLLRILDRELSILDKQFGVNLDSSDLHVPNLSQWLMLYGKFGASLGTSSNFMPPLG